MSAYKQPNFIPFDENTTIAFVGGFAINPGDNGNAFAVSQRNVIVTVIGSGTIKIHGSNDRLPPDFTVTSTILSSHTSPIVAADYSLASSQYVTALTVSNSTKIFELNTNLLTWIAFERTSGSPDIKITITDNL